MKVKHVSLPVKTRTTRQICKSMPQLDESMSQLDESMPQLDETVTGGS